MLENIQTRDIGIKVSYSRFFTVKKKKNISKLIFSEVSSSNINSLYL